MSALKERFSDLGQKAAEQEAGVPPEVSANEWADLVQKGSLLCRLIDRHLQYEEKGRRMLPNEHMTPIGFCPEQRVNLLTDVSAAVAAV